MTISRLTHLCCCAFFLLALPACHNSLVTVESASPVARPAIPPSSILILPPHIVSGRLHGPGGNSIRPNSDSIAEAIDRSIASSLTARGHHPILDRSPISPQAADALRSGFPSLVSEYKDKSSTLPHLAPLAPLAPYALALALEVHHGGRGGYNPNSGQIWEQTNSSTYTVVILALPNGDVVFRNQIFVRESPSKDKITRCIDLALKPLTTPGAPPR